MSGTFKLKFKLLSRCGTCPGPKDRQLNGSSRAGSHPLSGHLQYGATRYFNFCLLYSIFMYDTTECVNALRYLTDSNSSVKEYRKQPLTINRTTLLVDWLHLHTKGKDDFSLFSIRGTRKIVIHLLKCLFHSTRPCPQGHFSTSVARPFPLKPREGCRGCVAHPLADTFAGCLAE